MWSEKFAMGAVIKGLADSLYGGVINHPAAIGDGSADDEIINVLAGNSERVNRILSNS